jgi:hypothetical protein
MSALNAPVALDCFAKAPMQFVKPFLPGMEDEEDEEDTIPVFPSPKRPRHEPVALHCSAKTPTQFVKPFLPGIEDEEEEDTLRVLGFCLSPKKHARMFAAALSKSAVEPPEHIDDLGNHDEEQCAVSEKQQCVTACPRSEVILTCSMNARSFAASADRAADEIKEQVSDLAKYLEEKRSAVERQRLAEESSRAKAVRAQFPRTPKCVRVSESSYSYFDY